MSAPALRRACRASLAGCRHAQIRQRGEQGGPFRRTRSLAVPGRRMVPDAGNGSAPGMMATLARAVHHRQGTARQEYYRGDNQ